MPNSIEPPRLGEAVRRYLLYLDELGRSRLTLKTYATILKTLVFGREQDSVTDITKDDCRAAVSHYNTATSKSGSHSVYRMFFRYCRQQKWRRDDPTRFPRVKHPPVTRTPLTRDEVRAIWLATNRPSPVRENKRLLVALLLQGFVPSELEALVWGDIDFSAQTVIVRSARSNADRVVYLHPFVERLLRGAESSAESLDSRVITCCYQAMDQRIKKIGKRAGIDGLHMYRFRHTLVANWANLFDDDDMLPSRGRLPRDRQSRASIVNFIAPRAVDPKPDTARNAALGAEPGTPSIPTRTRLPEPMDARVQCADHDGQRRELRDVLPEERYERADHGDRPHHDRQSAVDPDL